MSKKLIALFISSIVIPVAVLTGLRLTGFMPGPIIVSDTLAASTAKWQTEMPSQIIGIYHPIKNSYHTSEISAFTIVSIQHYFGGIFWIDINGSASLPHGRIVKVNIEFRGNEYSEVDISKSEEKHGFPEEYEFKNLTATGIGDVGDMSLTGDLKAFVNLISPNDSRSVYFWFDPWFLVKDGAIHPNSLRVSVQFTYFNGTIFKKVVLPAIFTVVHDAPGSFESARLISFGDYTGFIDNVLDPEDYFEIWLDTNQTVRVKLFIPQPEGSYMNLYFYDPNKNLVANYSSLAVQFDYSIHQSGYWYLRLENTRTNLLYVLSIEKVE